jgi:hypothetical protein
MLYKLYSKDRFRYSLELNIDNFISYDWANEMFIQQLKNDLR